MDGIKAQILTLKISFLCDVKMATEKNNTARGEGCKLSYYNKVEVPPLMHSVEFRWKFVSDCSPPSPWQEDAQHTLIERSMHWFSCLDECLADALHCAISPTDVDSTHLVIEMKIYGDWRSLTNNDLRQTINVYAARRLFYPTTLQSR